MKKVFIAIYCVLQFANLSNAQSVDTVYEFTPAIIKGVSYFKKGSLIHYEESTIEINKDSIYNNMLKVVVEDINNEKTGEGNYKLDTVIITKAITLNRSTGERRKEVISVHYNYFREGYWYVITNGRTKKVYYYRGKILKINI